MPESTVLLIIFSAIVAIALAGFQYLFKSKQPFGSRWVLFISRVVGVFSLLLLLANPRFIDETYETEKPNLLLAVDNSASIRNIGKAEDVKEFVSAITKNPRINEKFRISTFAFGENVQLTDTFNFSDSRTNIQNVLKSFKSTYKNSNSATVLITDGNQTFGKDYLFEVQDYNNNLIPVVVGDTMTYTDLQITRVNVNKYAFLNNSFPVEIFLDYKGTEPVKSKLEIFNGNRVLFSKELSFNEEEASIVITALLPANSFGLNTYKAEVGTLKNEKNISNNRWDFAVEVIDERSSILLISNLVHPDLGAIKRSIETNQQREVKISNPSNVPENLDTYELIILYQPTKSFGPFWEKLGKEEKNIWVITGPETDWKFLNSAQGHFQKDISVQKEIYFPELNSSFTSFQISDIGFNNFPPLEDVFGDIKYDKQARLILTQQVQGISTGLPLMATVEEKNAKKAFLFGANLWKWRAHIFEKENSYASFDNFLGQFIQYLSSEKKRDRLVLTYDDVYYGSEKIIVSAQYFDKNYTFDSRGDLSLELVKKTEQERKIEVPMVLKGNSFQTELSNLSASEYFFTVKVEGENISKSGALTVVDFEVEDQFYGANLQGLQQIAETSEEGLYFLDQPQKLIDHLLSDNKYATVQKSRQNHVYLIDWYYLLAIIVFSFSTEWFVRKYHGLI